MKNLKFSFAMLIAILAVGVTVATKANFTGKATVISACFEQVTLQNQAGTVTQAPIASSDLCEDVRALASGTLIYLNDATTPVLVESCPTPETLFCCIKFTQIANQSDPAFSNVPAVDLGEAGGAKKYFIANAATDVLCRVN